MINTDKTSKDIAALNLVYQNEDRFYITVDESGEYVVFDTNINNSCYVFGNAGYMSELLLKYSELKFVKSEYIKYKTIA